jgi:hypothetical protein
LVGAHGQGNAHIEAYAKMADVEVAAVCDVDDSVLKQRCGEIVLVEVCLPELSLHFGQRF